MSVSLTVPPVLFRRLPLIALLLALIAVTGFPGAVVAAPDKASDDFNLGVGFYRDQRYQLCADTFRQFVGEFPEHPRTNLARVYLGLSLSALEEYAEARKHFADNLMADPDGANAADVRYRLGECSYYLKDYQSAVAQLKDYLSKHSGHTLNDWARLFIGDAHNELNQPAEAETVLRQLLETSTNASLLSDARFRLALSLEAQGKAQEAFELYREVGANEQSEFAPRALARIGGMYFSRERFEDAARVYDEIVTRFPGTAAAASAQLNSGLALYREKKWGDALKRLDAIPQDSSLAAQAVVLKALSLKELGRREEARTAFNAALAAAGDSPLAADIIFQQAQMERTAGQSAVAAQLFEDIADRWPQDQHVPESLFNAIELRIEGNDVDRAARLWNRLGQDAAAFAGEPRSLTLRGRLHLAQKQPAEAVLVLQQAAAAATDPASRNGAVARYYLVRAHQAAEQYNDVLTVAETIAPHVNSTELKDLREVLLLAATAALNLDRAADAKRYADQFLTETGAAESQRQALAVRLLASTQLKDYSAALTDAQSLVADYGQETTTWDAVLLAARTASDNTDWAEAGPFYAIAATNQKDPKVRESGLAGVAWSHYRTQKFGEAQAAFATVIGEFPTSADAPLLRHMQALSAEENDQPDVAAELYLALLKDLTASGSSVTGGLTERSPLRYAFDAGRQAARLFERQNEIERSDATWALVAERFAAVDGVDKVLDEWAHMNLQHERYDRADEIHRKLLSDFPDSPHAPEARLSLAESLLATGDADEAKTRFEGILIDPRSGDFVKSRAMYHLVDIGIATGDWDTAETLGRQFLTDFPDDDLRPRVRILLADALLNTGKTEEAQSHLTEVRDAVVASTVDAGPLTDRTWVLLTRAALDLKQYDQIDPLADELLNRSPDSPWGFQIRESQGRRWMQQAPPDFAKARDYFRQVIDDPAAKGSRTAANCQLLIADAHQREKNLAEARREYFLLYYTTEGNDDLRAEALYRAAVCEMDLKESASAVRSLRDLMEKFPESPRSQDAAEVLRQLGASSGSQPSAGSE